ncbi:NUDIX domain-containing protein [Paenibacillus sp. AR247]|uniref:NUDIX hydrolase n=1 Tax=Paenibacillus sp. AR247 TaxID=1631599 RepID=UPI000CF98EAF|nr:NUDIX domain-containing protein [Paenibacillus sp. AR247]PQP89116.1 DNA mismatch repair protein MutT [Paenibacillus sp. AR247]
MTTMIDKVAWIQIQDGRVLSARSKGKDTYYLPGGKREPGETDEQTLIREIREELTVAIDPETLAFVGTFEAQAHGKAENVTVQMSCYTGAYSGEPRPSAEIEEFAWLTYADRSRVSPVCQRIFDHLHERQWI